MCLAIPVRVVAKPNENTALIDLEGVQKEISLERTLALFAEAAA